ncbi:MAG: protein tyrosine phosphatase [Gammaproteobacteria bacterium]|nr:protein tyrosine phosphatase [Gammaproteobacteria bacterium]
MENILLDPRRHIKLKNAFNVRDLGGYPTQDGNITQWGRFLRSDGLHRLDAADQQLLVDYGVGLVVDLRLPMELKSSPNVFQNSTVLDYHHCSFLDEALLKYIEEQPVEDRTHLRADKGYCLWLDHCHQSVREILISLAENQDSVSLYHCSGGKDRTGLITALLLSIAGVDADLIVADYALTARFNIHSTFKPPEPDIKTWQDYEVAYCPSSLMHESLNHLQQVYGGAVPYIHHVGLTEKQISMLKKRLLESSEK